MTDSNVVYVARLHWLLFFGPTVLACAALFLGIYVPQLKDVALGFLLLSAGWWVMTWVNYHFSSLTIEKKRVIFRTGVLVRKTTDIPYSKIESVDVRQSLIGSIMRYGALMITGTGGTRHFISFLDKPLVCRRYIEQLTNEAQG
ncbi:PH domain-containing protein [Legionella sp. CNM-4043-24]|uniref:PH domain-containing protein n=1 Tax=Legionella sp. CNM-4043-24 TaxID=3421646 RepID=UPI00403B37CC